VTGLIEEKQLGVEGNLIRLGNPLMAHNTNRVPTLSREEGGVKRGLA